MSKNVQYATSLLFNSQNRFKKSDAAVTLHSIQKIDLNIDKSLGTNATG